MGRRGKGEGSIYRRADGRWVGSIDLGYINGKRRRKTVYGRTRKEVAEKIQHLLRDQASGANLHTERRTVAQYLDHWLEHVIKPNRAAQTYKTARYIIGRASPYVGSVQLDKLTPSHIQEMQNQLLGVLSPASVINVRAYLSSALNQAVQWGYISRNPVTLVKAPRHQPHEVVPFTQEQAQQLLEAAQGERLEALYWVALYLGLRRGELLALRWADIDLEARTLYIRQGKTEKSRRLLPLIPALVDKLQAHWQYQQIERVLRDDWKEHGLVFPSEVGTPLSGLSLWRTFKRLLKQAGLPETFTLHDLRHSCASFLIARGVGLKVLQEILGHSNIAITANIYAHVDTKTKKAALIEFQDWLHVGYNDDTEGAADDAQTV